LDDSRKVGGVGIAPKKRARGVGLGGLRNPGKGLTKKQRGRLIVKLLGGHTNGLRSNSRPLIDSPRSKAMPV